LSKARAQANEVACASNLHQMGIALVMYTNETKYYPGCQAWGSAADPFAAWPTRLRWAMRMKPSQTGAVGTKGGGGIEKIFWCPQNLEGFQWSVTFGSGTGYATASDVGYGYDEGESLLLCPTIYFSYGYNDWGYGNSVLGRYQQKGLGGDLKYPLPPTQPQFAELKASQVKKAAEMIAIADNTGAGAWKFNIDSTQSDQYPSKIHRGGANFLFCDGHVEWHLQKEMTNLNPVVPAHINIIRLWNNDNSY
jgi:prepilin-type processing-associated H-X9-DG protein